MASIDNTTTKDIRAIGGSSIHVVFQFPGGGKHGLPPYLYIGSMISVSYSIYREKIAVYNLGQTVMDGVSVGKKVVAGSCVKAVLEDDEIKIEILKQIKDAVQSKSKAGGLGVDFEELSKTLHNKDMKFFMKDDISSFNMIIIYSSEYAEIEQQEIIYDVNIINNGQVASIADIITETTFSFLAREVQSLHDISLSETFGISPGQSPYTSASSLLV
jgi:hypothetical protein